MYGTKKEELDEKETMWLGAVAAQTIRYLDKPKYEKLIQKAKRAAYSKEIFNRFIYDIKKLDAYTIEDFEMEKIANYDLLRTYYVFGFLLEIELDKKITPEKIDKISFFLKNI